MIKRVYPNWSEDSFPESIFQTKQTSPATKGRIEDKKKTYQLPQLHPCKLRRWNREEPSRITLKTQQKLFVSCKQMQQQQKKISPPEYHRNQMVGSILKPPEAKREGWRRKRGDPIEREESRGKKRYFTGISLIEKMGKWVFYIDKKKNRVEVDGSSWWTWFLLFVILLKEI